MRGRLARRQFLEEPRLAGGQLHDAVLIEAQHHLAHDGRSRVVQVHDRLLRAGQGLERSPDQLFAGLRQYLEGDVIGTRSSSISFRMKSNSTCEADGKPTSISLKPI